MTEINKCPVCGGPANVTDSYVYCDGLDCGTAGPNRETKEEAIAVWNRLSYKAPVKKTEKVAWVRKNAEGGGKLSFAILLDTLDTEPYYRGLGYDIVDVKEVEFEIE